MTACSSDPHRNRVLCQASSIFVRESFEKTQVANDQADSLLLACCREDIEAILKWIDALTDELCLRENKLRKPALWNLRTELDNSLKSRGGSLRMRTQH